MKQKDVKRFLRLEIIWKDEHMFELKVDCNNGRYSGTTEVYDTNYTLLPFAKSLKDYPYGGGERIHRCGEEDSHSFFEMRFYQIGTSGIVGVEVKMEANVATQYRPEEKDKLKLELIVEPNAIDIFQKELETLALNESGIAELIGIAPYTNNII